MTSPWKGFHTNLDFCFTHVTPINCSGAWFNDSICFQWECLLCTIMLAKAEGLWREIQSYVKGMLQQTLPSKVPRMQTAGFISWGYLLPNLRNDCDLKLIFSLLLTHPHKTQQPLKSMFLAFNFRKLSTQETHRKLDAFRDEELNQYLLGLLQKMDRKASLMKMSFFSNDEFNLNPLRCHSGKYNHQPNVWFHDSLYTSTICQWSPARMAKCNIASLGMICVANPFWHCYESMAKGWLSQGFYWNSFSLFQYLVCFSQPQFENGESKNSVSPTILQPSCWNKVDRLLNDTALNTNQLPLDRRKFNGRKLTDKTASADSFFTHYYHHVVTGFDTKSNLILILHPVNLFSPLSWSIFIFWMGSSPDDWHTRLRLWQKLQALKWIHMWGPCISVVPYFQATCCQTRGFGFWTVSISISL